MPDIQEDQQLCEFCNHTWNLHKPLGQYSGKNDERCLAKDCECSLFGIPPESQPDPALYSSLPKTGMTNAQAALIASAMSLPRGSDIREVRGRASEFSWMLDNVDRQNRPGSRTWPNM